MKITVKGAAAAQAALRELKDTATAKRIGRKAIKQAAEIIATKARSLAPDDPATGAGKFLRQSIKVAPPKRARFNRGQSRGNIDAEDQVWMLIGIDQSVDPPKEVRRKNGKGSYRDPGVAGVSVIMEFGAPGGNISPRPFMGPAWESEKEATAQRIVDNVTTEAFKAAERAARKRARGK